MVLLNRFRRPFPSHTTANEDDQTNSVKVLVADDNAVSRRLLQVSLVNFGYIPTITSDGTEAMRALDEPDCPRLAILDWMMPKMDGIEVCRRIRKSAKEPYVYVILLTAKEQQTEIIEGLEAGADDYITKPFDLDELKARLRAGKRILDLQEQLVSAREELRVRATHDSLTQLLNRAAILEILRKEVARSARERTPLAVILMDLDHFKNINDTQGHLAGDAVLRESARRMRESLRPYDSVGRYGGEEFLAVTPGCNTAQVIQLAERIRERICGELFDVSACTLRVTMSLGVSSTARLMDPDQLLRDADEALYAAKNQGRNRVEAKSSVGKEV